MKCPGLGKSNAFQLPPESMSDCFESMQGLAWDLSEEFSTFNCYNIDETALLKAGHLDAGISGIEGTLIYAHTFVRLLGPLEAPKANLLPRLKHSQNFCLKQPSKSNRHCPGQVEPAN